MTGSPDPRRRAWALLLATLLAAGCAPGPPPPPASDLPAVPARRIIALAPHLAELAYAAGAGDYLVGTVAFSDHPAAARALPRVGDAFRIDLEALASLRPDLLLGWPSGNSPAALQRLRQLGYRVVELEPGKLMALGDQIEQIGQLAGTGETARASAVAWRKGLAALEAAHGTTRAGRVFYQVAPEPLITVTGRHFIGEAIELCGGDNVFADLPGLTAVVSVESVLAAAPGVIIANDYTRGAGAPATGSPLDTWQAWPRMPAVRDGRLHLLDPDLMSVPGPRLLEGISRLCAALAGSS